MKTKIGFIKLSFILLISFSFLSCTSAQKRAGVGGAVGTILGAGIGGITGGKKGAVTGAVIGAVGGTLLGYMYHLQQETADLTAKVNQTAGRVDAMEHKVDNVTEKIILTFRDSVLFENDSAEILSGGKNVLDDLAEMMKKHPESKAVIRGHTDSIGGEEYNLALSRWRADAVKNYLVTRGVNFSRLEAHGMGENYPVVSNQTAEGRRLNRRVEIVIS